MIVIEFDRGVRCKKWEGFKSGDESIIPTLLTNSCRCEKPKGLIGSLFFRNAHYILMYDGVFTIGFLKITQCVNIIPG